MTFFDELGLKAAEQLEASVGPYVALASYKRLFGAEGSVREQGVLGALRCAIKLGDDREVETAAKELARLRGPTPIALGFAANVCVVHAICVGAIVAVQSVPLNATPLIPSPE